LDDEQLAWLDERVAEANAEVVEHNRLHRDDQRPVVSRGDWLRWMLDEWRVPRREPDRRRLRGTG
jgi:hypothetical protein